MPRQQPPLLEPQPSNGWSHLLVALPVPHDEPRNGPFPPGKLHCSLRYRYVDRVEFRHVMISWSYKTSAYFACCPMMSSFLAASSSLASSAARECCLQRSCVLFQLQSCVHPVEPCCDVPQFVVVILPVLLAELLCDAPPFAS